MFSLIPLRTRIELLPLENRTDAFKAIALPQLTTLEHRAGFLISAYPGTHSCFAAYKSTAPFLAQQQTEDSDCVIERAWAKALA